MTPATTTPSELADARWDAAHEEATASLDESDLFEELTETERRMLITEALLGRPTRVFADAAERIITRKTRELHIEATLAARGQPLQFEYAEVV